MPAKRNVSRSGAQSDVYVALLRGINVGGNNMVSMKALKESFAGVGFSDIATYINSGNVLFRAGGADARALEGRIDDMLAREYALKGKTVVRSRSEMVRLGKAIDKAWGEPTADTRYYVIFLRHPVDSKGILKDLQPKPEIESVVYHPGALLWSANIDSLTRTAMNKLPARAIYQEMTIRNLNTTRRLVEMMQAMD